MHRRALLGGVAAAAAASLTGCMGAQSDDQYEETRDVEFDLPAEDTAVSVSGKHGDVAVSTHDSEQVAVTARLSGPSEERVDGAEVAGQTGADGLSVALAGTTDGVSAAFDVQVPAGTAVGELETSNGDIDVQDVAGVESATTDNGDVTVQSAGPVSAAETTNGAVTIDEPAPLSGDVTAVSNNGDVSVSLSPDADAEVVARTDNGETGIEDLELFDLRRDGDDGMVRGVLGEGTHEVVAESDNGDVEFDAL